MGAADPAEALRARNLRVTPQRRAILAAFEDRADEHLSADEVHARASRSVPEVSRGTVYSTLAELTELGLLAAIGSPEPVRYESNVAAHDHFRCRCCARLFDVELGRPDTVAVEAAGHRVEGVGVVVEGVCSDCERYRRGLHDGADAIARTPQLTGGIVDTLACRRHDSPLGSLLVAATDRGIVRVAFEDHADFDALRARARRRTGSREARGRLTHAEDAFDAYFGGAHGAATDVVDWATAAVAHPAALEATRDIPFGRHRSYVGICEGVDAYACGYAMGTNPVPVLLPCHRVALGSVRPEGYVGGGERLRALTRLEAHG